MHERPVLMLKRILVGVLVAVVCTGCVFPSDPGPGAMGLSVEGQDLIAWIPSCTGGTVTGIRVSSLSPSGAAEGETVWSAKTTESGEQALAQGNPSLSMVRGDYSGVPEVFVVVETTGRNYLAYAKKASLRRGSVLFQGQYLTSDEFATESQSACE